MENFPEDVLSEIFIRLLAKQLAQMRCVCKPWNALLSKSTFVRSHLHHSIHNNNELLVFFSSEAFWPSYTAGRFQFPNLEFTNFIKLPVNIQRTYRYNIIGSINGLICFSYESHHQGLVISIWNPSLSAVSTLAPVSSSFPDIELGFGFDSKADDYKVVKLTRLFEPFNNAMQAEVYSMRKGSWELIPRRFPLHITTFYDKTNVCVNGHLHWIGYTYLKWKPMMIVAFDLGRERFREIPLPYCVQDYNLYNWNYIGVLGGKLCVMSRVRDGGCEVWVMNKHGVAESWVKHHAFSELSGEIAPYGFTSRSEFLYGVDDRFALCDVVEAKTNTFKFSVGNSVISKVVEYVDSLVWIEPANPLKS